MERKLYKSVTDRLWKERLLPAAGDHALYDVYTPLVGRRGVAPPPSNPHPPSSQIGRGKSLVVSQAALRDLSLRAVSYFSSQF